MKLFKNIITYTILAIVLVFVIGTLVLKVFGIKSDVVISDSMYPTIPKYSFVYYKELDSDATIDDLVVNKDVLVIDEGLDSYLMHRYVGKEGNTVITNGDNNAPDVTEENSFDKVVGVVLFHIPLIGLIFANNYIWISLVLIVLIVMIVLELRKEIKKKKKEENKPEENK